MAKRILALLMAVMMLVCMASCGEDKKKEDKKDDDKKTEGTANTDKDNADQGNADQGNADQGNADQGNADQDNNSIKGTWEYKATEDGMDLSVVLVFEADGIFEMDMVASYEGETERDSYEGTYTVVGDTVTLINPEYPDEPLVFKHSNGKLYSEEMDGEFTKK